LPTSREAFPNRYIRVSAYDARYTRQTTAVSSSSTVEVEPGFRLDRAEVNDRVIHYQLHSYAAEDAHGTRYQDNGSGPEPD